MAGGGRWQVWPYWQSLVVLLAPLLLLPLPLVVGSSEARCGYVMLLMAIFWMTEALPLSVTALIPVFGFPLLGIMSTGELTMVYMKETNMMFLGGLTVAIAVEHCNLHRRIALMVLLNAGQSPRRLMMGFMLTTMFLSMWISNTATTAMMVPIVEAIMLELFAKEKEMDPPADCTALAIGRDEPPASEKTGPVAAKVRKEFADEASGEVDKADLLTDIGKKMRLALMLSVAYSANIGGTGVITGTAPNLILIGQLKEAFPDQSTGLTFASWMGFNIPGMLICVVLAWGWLQVIFIGFKGTGLGDTSEEQKLSVRALLQQKYKELGSMSFHESAVLTLFVSLVLLWLFRAPEFVKGWAHWFDLAYDGVAAVEDATPVMLIIFLLFAIPNKLDFWCFRDPRDPRPPRPSQGCLTWQVVEQRVPWGIVLLLGGGFAMAEASEAAGLNDWMGEQLEAFDVMPKGVIVFVLCLLTAMLTEVTSNTATASILMPVLAKLSVNIEVNPIYLMLPTTICCSYAFMLPVATPPNAIVFSATRMATTDMMKAGFMMNLVCVCVVTLMINTLGVAMFDVLEFPDWARNGTAVQQALSRHTAL